MAGSAEAVTSPVRLGLRRFVAAVEIVGGLWGLFRTAQHLWRPGMQWTAIAIVVIITVIFLLLLIAGLLLWSDRPGGRQMSQVVQIVQLPHIVTAPFGFFFGSPVSISAGIVLGGGLKVLPIWNPSVGFALDSDVEVSWIGINLLALLLLLCLWALDRRRHAAPIPDA